MSDYAYWTALLAGERPICHPDKPELGFYRRKRGNGKPDAIAIWRSSDGQIIATVNGQIREPVELWSTSYFDVIHEEDYRHWQEHGRFPDELDPPPIGHNSGLDGSGGLADEIETAILAALTEIKDGIADQLKADRAANYRSRLLDLTSRVEAERKEKKRPFLDGAKAVDTEYQALSARLDEALLTLKVTLTPWLLAVEAQKKAAARQAIAAGADPATINTKVHAGTVGRKVTGLRTHYSAEITDYTAAVAHFADHEDVRAVVQKLCNQQARAGVKEGPGWKRKETKEAA